MRKADITTLLRDPRDTIYTWSKSGIILRKGFTTVNLNELEEDMAIDILYDLLDKDLSYTQRQDTKEVLDYFKNK